jgi:CRISPR-associated endonuclease Csn1
LPDGSLWAEGINYFEANKRNPILKRPHPAAKLVLKIHKGDILRLIDEDREKIARVVTLIPAGKQILLIEPFEGGNLAKRNKQLPKGQTIYISLSFSQIKERRVRKVYVDPLGRVRDPGAIL